MIDASLDIVNDKLKNSIGFTVIKDVFKCDLSETKILTKKSVKAF